MSVGNNSQNCLRNDPEFIFKVPKHKKVVEQDFHLNFRSKLHNFIFFFLVCMAELAQLALILLQKTCVKVLYEH